MSTHAMRSARPKIETRLASDPNDLAMVAMLRAAAFLADTNIPYAKEFNGNDHVATYFLTLVDGDPAGTIRIRWYRECAVMEKVCIRRCYRGGIRVFRSLASAAIEHARRKGHCKIVGRALEDTAVLWERLYNGRKSGPAVPTPLGPAYPILLEFPPHPDGAVSNLQFGQPETEALLASIEGLWDFSVDGALEQERVA